MKTQVAGTQLNTIFTEFDKMQNDKIYHLGIHAEQKYKNVPQIITDNLALVGLTGRRGAESTRVGPPTVCLVS